MVCLTNFPEESVVTGVPVEASPDFLIFMIVLGIPFSFASTTSMVNIDVSPGLNSFWFSEVLILLGHNSAFWQSTGQYELVSPALHIPSPHTAGHL